MGGGTVPAPVIQISEATLYSIIATLGVFAFLLLIVLILAGLMMFRISRLSKALAATTDAELKTKLLQQSSWWPRFRFRTMLVLIAMFAIGLGMFVAEWNRAKRQAQIVEQFERSYGEVYAHYRLGIFGDGMIAKLLCHWIHPDFGCTLTDLSIGTYDDSDNSQGVTDSDLSRLIKIRSLESVAIGAGDFSNEGIIALTKLPRLKRFSIHGYRLDEEAIAALAKAKKLEILELRSAGLHGTELAELEKLTQLNTLNLHANEISSVGIESLKQLKHVATIEVDDDGSISQLSKDQLGNLRVISEEDDAWLYRWDFYDNRPMPDLEVGGLGSGDFSGSMPF